MKILIAGGGIGGLTAALCLQKSGHDVSVFEESSAFAEMGAGLQCGANALRVMDYLGLLGKIEKVSVAPQRLEFRDGFSGKPLYTTQLGEEYRERYGVPYLHVHRAHLHRVLEQALRHDSDGQLIMNARVKAYQQSAGSVEIKLADGRTFTGDCLIGADGVKSKLRHQLLGDTTPHFTGNVAWRGVVPADRLPDDFMDTIASNFMGPRKHMVIHYLHKRRQVNFVGVVENSDWREYSWVSKAPWRELKDDYKGWHPTVQAVIDAVDKERCYRWALHNHRPFENWSSERVTLLGDAAHSTLPYMASGAAMAIEDARILQRALDQAGEITAGFQLYQRNRFARTARIQKLSTRMGSLYHITNPLLLKLAFKSLQLVPGKRESFLPEYDANTVRLV
ncbi:MAG: FAD-dependent monooxygenase [Arenicella sp.]|nr:FAD-dependent monooxygenase [Arenicella sp.]